MLKKDVCMFRCVSRKDFKEFTTDSAEPLKLRSINARFSKENDQGNSHPETLEGYYSRILNLTLSISHRIHTKEVVKEFRFYSILNSLLRTLKIAA